ncbi:MAG: hypothetical protein JSR37_08115 [Verrucomicrobia bacterium]|nr:hypothetical protein [Verrucomicrobiota bacterium]MBS0638051.1 hypothetical protein [Verrucomicrobiota bacterium]
MSFLAFQSVDYVKGNLLYFSGDDGGISPVNARVGRLASKSQHHPISNRVCAVTFGMPAGTIMGGVAATIGGIASSFYSRANRVHLSDYLGIWGERVQVCGEIGNNVDNFVRNYINPLVRVVSGQRDFVAEIGNRASVAWEAGKACLESQEAFTMSKIGNAVLPIVNEYGHYIAGAMALGSLAGYSWYVSSYEGQEKQAQSQLVTTLKRRIDLAAYALDSQENKNVLANKIIQRKQAIKTELKAATGLSDKQVNKVTKELFKAAKKEERSTPAVSQVVAAAANHSGDAPKTVSGTEP